MKYAVMFEIEKGRKRQMSRPLLVLSYWLREMSDFLYGKVIHNDYTSPTKCPHCNKFNFDKGE